MKGGYYIRYCPVCSNKIKHKVLHRRSDGIKENRHCRTCSNKLSSTQEVRDKIRISFYKRKDGHGFRFTPSYNKRACAIFDEINNTFGWNGYHAENVGEYKVLGYFLDYYEPNLNIAIEFDEKHHNEKKVKVKDSIKQHEISSHLSCMFFRIKDGQDWREVLKQFIHEQIKIT